VGGRDEKFEVAGGLASSRVSLDESVREITRPFQVRRARAGETLACSYCGKTGEGSRWDVKVIRVDNYDDEGPRGTQELIAGPGLSQGEADAIVDRMNGDPRRVDYDFFKVVPDEHELWSFEP
jgi:hypothetical protein